MIALRLFAARIVVGEVDAVGETRRYGAHLRPLPAIAVAAAAEDDGERAARRLAQRLQRRLERVGRVRVIDDDVDVVADVPLHSPGNAMRFARALRH